MATPPPSRPTPDFLLWAHQLKREHACLRQRVGDLEAKAGIVDPRHDAAKNVEARLLALERNGAKESEERVAVTQLEKQIEDMGGNINRIERFNVSISDLQESTGQSKADIKELKARYAPLDAEVSEQAREIKQLHLQLQAIKTTGREREDDMHKTIKELDDKLQEFELDPTTASDKLAGWELKIHLLERQGDQHEREIFKINSITSDLNTRIKNERLKQHVNLMLEEMKGHLRLIYESRIRLEDRMHWLDGRSPVPTQAVTRNEVHRPSEDGQHVFPDSNKIEIQAHRSNAKRALFSLSQNELAEPWPIVQQSPNSGTSSPTSHARRARRRRRKLTEEPSHLPHQSNTRLLPQSLSRAVSPAQIKSQYQPHEFELERGRAADSIAFPIDQLQRLQSQDPPCTPNFPGAIVDAVGQRVKFIEHHTPTTYGLRRDGVKTTKNISTVAGLERLPTGAGQTTSHLASYPQSDLQQVQDNVPRVAPKQGPLTQVFASSPFRTLSPRPIHDSETQLPTPSHPSSTVSDSQTPLPLPPSLPACSKRKRTVAERELDIPPPSRWNETDSYFAYENPPSQSQARSRQQLGSNGLDRRLQVSLPSQTRQTRSQTKAASQVLASTSLTSQVRGLTLGLERQATGMSNVSMQVSRRMARPEGQAKSGVRKRSKASQGAKKRR